MRTRVLVAGEDDRGLTVARAAAARLGDEAEVVLVREDGTGVPDVLTGSAVGWSPYPVSAVEPDRHCVHIGRHRYLYYDVLLVTSDAVALLPQDGGREDVVVLDGDDPVAEAGALDVLAATIAGAVPVSPPVGPR